MKKLEKLIYSKSWLPPILYFASVAWIIYIIYSYFYLDKDIKIFQYGWLNSVFQDIFFVWFFYITYLVIKNYKKNQQ